MNTGIGADDGACSTADAKFGVYVCAVGVALAVYLGGGKGYSLRRTGYDAEVTAFASVGIYDDGAVDLCHNISMLNLISDYRWLFSRIEIVLMIEVKDVVDHR